MTHHHKYQVVMEKTNKIRKHIDHYDWLYAGIAYAVTCYIIFHLFVIFLTDLP